MEDLIYKIALTRIPGIGPVTARSLLSYCGDAKSVFTSPIASLNKIQGIGTQTIKAIRKFRSFDPIEEEVEWYQKRGIRTLFIQDKDFPYRLRHTPDGPLVLFVEGNLNFNQSRMLAVIGTRKPSHYGIKITYDLIAALSRYNCVIVSGMAYGIDIQAHRSSVENDLPTVGVLAHGLDMIYPPSHTSIARDIVKHGGAMVSEFPRGTLPDAMNFPKRNRVVSGLCDGVIVIESSAKGGSMITADLAVQYDRDVMAIPGRINDRRSEGCNHLIKTQKAHLVESIEDIMQVFNWDLENQQVETQIKIPEDLTKDEKFVLGLITERSRHIDEIISLSKNMNNVSHVLLELELRGLAYCLPGKMYTKA